MLFIYRKLQPFLQKREERRQSEAAAAQRLRNVYRRELAWISRGAEARRTKSRERIERFNELEQEVKKYFCIGRTGNVICRQPIGENCGRVRASGT